MNAYTMAAIVNVAIVLCVFGAIWVTGSCWPLVGFFFLYEVKKSEKEKAKEEDDQ